jgi:nitroreductase
MEAIEALMTRVSAGALSDPAPDDDAVTKILAAAARAPDHGRLRPWRFFIVRGDARKALGTLMGRALKKRFPESTDAQIERERGKPLRAPMIVVVGAKVNRDSKIPGIEQILSAGAAAQNLQVAAHALGFGCAWKTGDAAYDRDVKAAFGLEESDAIVGFLYLGTPSHPLPPPKPFDMQPHIVEWPGTRADQ